MGIIIVIIGLAISFSPMLLPNKGAIDFFTVLPALVIGGVLMIWGGIKTYHDIMNAEIKRDVTILKEDIPKLRKKDYNEKEHFIYYNLFLKDKYKHK
jgi:hypothetical protein